MANKIDFKNIIHQSTSVENKDNPFLSSCISQMLHPYNGYEYKNILDIDRISCRKYEPVDKSVGYDTIIEH